MKRHHEQSNSYKGKHVIGAGLQFGGSVHYGHGGKHGVCGQACLEKEFYILIPRQQEGSFLLASRIRVSFYTGWSLSVGGL